MVIKPISFLNTGFFDKHTPGQFLDPHIPLQIEMNPSSRSGLQDNKPRGRIKFWACYSNRTKDSAQSPWKVPQGT